MTTTNKPTRTEIVPDIPLLLAPGDRIEVRIKINGIPQCAYLDYKVPLDKYAHLSVLLGEYNVPTQTSQS